MSIFKPGTLFRLKKDHNFYQKDLGLPFLYEAGNILMFFGTTEVILTKFSFRRYLFLNMKGKKIYCPSRHILEDEFILLTDNIVEKIEL